jgi:hypothetical protein
VLELLDAVGVEPTGDHGGSVPVIKASFSSCRGVAARFENLSWASQPVFHLYRASQLVFHLNQFWASQVVFLSDLGITPIHFHLT